MDLAKEDSGKADTNNCITSALTSASTLLSFSSCSTSATREPEGALLNALFPKLPLKYSTLPSIASLLASSWAALASLFVSNIRKTGCFVVRPFSSVTFMLYDTLCLPSRTNGK